MTICGYRLRDHLRLFSPLFGFVAAVWVLRLVLAAAGAPLRVVSVFSVTGAAALAVLFATLMIHMRRFGSYPNVVAASLLIISWGQALIILAIVFSVVTKTNNIFTAPEFSVRGEDPYHLRHIVGHLTFGIGAGTLFGAAAGCFLLWILRLLVPDQPGNGNRASHSSSQR
jgi:hypothetical protein